MSHIQTRGSAKTSMLSNKTYDAIRWVAQYFLPALGTLYVTIATIWGLPGGEQVSATVIALALFLGVIMGISKKSYTAGENQYDGVLRIGDIENDGLQVDRTLEELEGMDEIKIKVQSAFPQS